MRFAIFIQLADCGSELARQFEIPIAHAIPAAQCSQ
jgi:hypothetical protein